MSGSSFSVVRRVPWLVILGIATFPCVVSAQMRGQRDGAVIQPIHSKIGFLFIDSTYISAPYQVESDGEGLVTINGVVYQAAEYLPPKQEKAESVQLASTGGRTIDQRPDRSGSMDRYRYANRSFMGGRRGGRFGRARGNRSSADRVVSQLSDLSLGSVILMQRNTQPVSLDATRDGHEFLKLLVGQPNSSDTEVSFETTVLNNEVCQDVLTQAQLTPELTRRAEDSIAQVAFAQLNNQASSSSLIWNERLGFPLTLLAMVLVVAAFGHLLSNSPKATIEMETPEGQKLNRKTIVHSLILVGVFSAIDLIWTLMANQAGSMRELNPLGSGIIDNPIALIVFKVGITSLVIGLLYRLHQQPAARVASWWCCLILTLLTARWLTFQSMFL